MMPLGSGIALRKYDIYFYDRCVERFVHNNPHPQGWDWGNSEYAIAL